MYLIDFLKEKTYMSTRVNISPISRIEGHLAVHLDIDNGVVKHAECSGEMFRGFEVILKGRDPLDAQQIAQRICGVCPASHGIAAILALDEAFGIQPPTNGRLLRNIILGANFIQSHITHFYQLSAMDFIDITAVLDYRGNDESMNRVKQWVASEIRSNKIFPAAPFLPRYEGDYLKSVSAVNHYLTAFDMRQLAHQIGAEIGGKIPHVAALVPGGVTTDMPSMKIASCLSRFKTLKNFIETSFYEDVVAVSKYFPEYFKVGASPGNYLCYGVFQDSDDSDETLFPSGIILNGKLEEFSPDLINEDVTYGFYTPESGGKPMTGQTVPDPQKADAYTWIKAPRYGGHVMEVGPIARVMVSYKKGYNDKINQWTDRFSRELGIRLSDFNSILGRHIARFIECSVLVDRCIEWLNMVDPSKPVFTKFKTPGTGQGVGFTEAPRGALAHYISIKHKRIDVYQCVVPTTWNCSPRDANGTAGPVEQALVGTSVEDKENPIEATRLIRSFDPCLACAVH